MSNSALKLSRPTIGLRNFCGDLNGSGTHKCVYLCLRECVCVACVKSLFRAGSRAFSSVCAYCLEEGVARKILKFADDTNLFRKTRKRS